MKRRKYFHCDEILQRFRHFQSTDVHVTSVDEIVHPLVLSLIEMRHALCNLIRVVWKFEIDASTVNVECRTQ